MVAACTAPLDQLRQLDPQERLDALNRIRLALHELSPLRREPVDCVLWVPADEVLANDYNPNTVAPAELALLRLSVEADGFTMPVVTGIVGGSKRETVDGFHRGEVGRAAGPIRDRCLGRLPVSTIRSERGSREDRMAATVRHNRARGKHGVDAMSAIVMELVRRNWSEERIAKELGMDADEVLRLRQVTGLAEMFRDREFSEAWETAEPR